MRNPTTADLAKATLTITDANEPLQVVRNISDKDFANLILSLLESRRVWALTESGTDGYQAKLTAVYGVVNAVL